MTIAQFEQRLAALEQTVAQIRVQLAKQQQTAEEDEDFVPGAEYDLTPDVTPHAEFEIRARIISVEDAPPGLGLSDEEWASLPLDDEDS